ncbi:hypothetical protein ACPUEK_14715 [Marinomonas gallaica]|uniref:hypothetical protein n=1 Tax=Marinomonas gallaica TaxID=1806667 RepID=UPI003CE597C4
MGNTKHALNSIKKARLEQSWLDRLNGKAKALPQITLALHYFGANTSGFGSPCTCK